jgi:hypothetical protein
MQDHAQPSWGAAAIGSSGDVTVELDEATSGPERWRLTVTTPNWHLRFEVAAPLALEQLLEFIRAHNGRTAFATLPLGTFHGAPVAMRKDDEYPDRFFLVLEGEQLAFFNLSGDELHDLTAAIHHAATDS